MVYRLAYQFAGNHHDAEDIAQDVFIKVYRSLDRFRYDAQLTSWLYRIVMNACIDHKRRQSPAGWAPFTEEAELQMVNTPTEEPGTRGPGLRRPARRGARVGDRAAAAGAAAGLHDAAP